MGFNSQPFSPFTLQATYLGGQGRIEPCTPMGAVSDSGKLKICNSASSDGSQTMIALSGAVVDTTGGDIGGPAIVGGILLPQSAIVGLGSDTVSTYFNLNALGAARSGIQIYVY